MNTYEEFNRSKSKCNSCEVGSAYKKVVLSDGNTLDPKVVIIGEAPGANEILEGRPFVGKAGKLLRSTLEKYGFNNSNLLITNVLPCRPLDNKFPKDRNIVKRCVDKWLLEEIRITNPDYILLVGAQPIKYILGLSGVTKLRGSLHSFQVFATGRLIQCMPTYHPSYVLRKQYMSDGAMIREQFEQDIRRIALLSCVLT